MKNNKIIFDLEDAIAGLKAAAGCMDRAGIGKASNSSLATYRLENFAGLLTVTDR